jgi:hypothetical protein
MVKTDRITRSVMSTVGKFRAERDEYGGQRQAERDGYAGRIANPSYGGIFAASS